jgi:predicted enzyme related to lactoylglutathione lyase
MANPVGWFEIYVDDLARAVRFYEAVLQLKLQELPSPEVKMWAFPMDPQQAGSSGALVHMAGLKAGGNSTIVYFNSDDCAVEAARVASAGGRIMKDKFSIGQYGFIALAYDTEGNVFGLYSRK